MKLLKKKLLLLFILLISIVFTLSALLLWSKYESGLQYEYGVKLSISEKVLPPFFSSQLSKNYDFHTVLFAKDGYKDKRPMAVDQAYSLIYIDHLILAKPHPDIKASQEIGNLRLSRLKFGNHPGAKEDRQNIEIQSITLEHFNIKGDKIEPFVENNYDTFIECMNSERYECVYERAYKENILPEKIIEKIDVKFTYNGKLRRVEKEFLIVKKPYSSLKGRIHAAMMSI